MKVIDNGPGFDPTCEHGTALDVHCCGCHSGFLFDIAACHCIARGEPGPMGLVEWQRVQEVRLRLMSDDQLATLAVEVAQMANDIDRELERRGRRIDLRGRVGAADGG